MDWRKALRELPRSVRLRRGVVTVAMELQRIEHRLEETRSRLVFYESKQTELHGRWLTLTGEAVNGQLALPGVLHDPGAGISASDGAVGLTGSRRR